MSTTATELSSFFQRAPTEIWCLLVIFIIITTFTAQRRLSLPSYFASLASEAGELAARVVAGAASRLGASSVPSVGTSVASSSEADLEDRRSDADGRSASDVAGVATTTVSSSRINRLGTAAKFIH